MSNGYDEYKYDSEPGSSLLNELDSEGEEDDKKESSESKRRRREPKQPKEPKISKRQKMLQDRPHTIADLELLRISRIRVDLSSLLTDNRTSAFHSPLKKSNKGIAFLDAPHLTLPGLTDALQSTFWPNYNPKLITKLHADSNQFLKQIGAFKPLHSSLQMVMTAQMGFIPNKKYAATGRTGGTLIDRQVSAAINGRTIPLDKQGRGQLVALTPHELQILTTSPWGLTVDEVHTLLPEARAYLVFMSQERKCRPVVAQVYAWDKEVGRATPVEQIWLKQDTLELVLVEMKLGQDYSYEMGTDSLNPPYEKYSNCSKNQHLIQLYFEKRMAEFTFRVCLNHAWVVRIANSCTVSVYSLEDEPWVEEHGGKAVERLKSEFV